MTQIIGLTGLRGVGKSTVANILVEHHGFTRVHAFDGGKAATRSYFRHIGAPSDMADRMVFGNLRDMPCPLLPGSQTPRYFMERFGKFMGKTLGAEWTLGAELDVALRQTPWASIVVESVVYEAPLLKERGGKLYRVERDVAGPAGLETDAAQAALEVDGTIINNGSLAELRTAVEALL